MNEKEKLEMAITNAVREFEQATKSVVASISFNKPVEYIYEVIVTIK